MLAGKRAHRWVLVAAAALLSCGYVMDVTAAITPPRGSCKPINEPPEDGKQKATNPGSGGKGSGGSSGDKTKGGKPA